MKRVKIYTAGAMKNIIFEEQIKWRIALENCLKAFKDSRCELVFIHPPYYYNYESHSQINEAEIKEYELNQVRDSDIIVVNLNHINNSVGTHYELSYADAINSFGHKHIYVIGIGSTANVHPWILSSLFRVEDSVESAANYIKEYLLV